MSVPTKSAGDLLLSFAPFFKLYIGTRRRETHHPVRAQNTVRADYVNNHGKALNLLTAMQKDGSVKRKYRKFVEFADNASRDPRSNGNNIHSFLIMPVQRVPRCSFW